jgi:hypothetical protein
MSSNNELPDSSTQEAATGRFSENLLRGIHDAAQPLTILRASLGKDQTDRMSLIELRELATSSAVEVERVCTFFNFLQQLVIIEAVKPQLSEMPIEPLVAYATEGVNLLFARDGMFLRTTITDSCRPVLINRARTLEALSGVLLVAHVASDAQDTIELIASSSSSHAVNILVRNANSHLETMHEEARLRLALAEANLRSQHATVSWSLQPFCVQIGLDEPL